MPASASHRVKQPHAEIMNVVRQVRRRWRLKLMLRGLALTLTGMLLTFLVSASTLELLRFQEGPVVAFRVALWTVVGLCLVRWVLWPLFRRVSDERVALYLEEHEPALASSVLTVVEAPHHADPAREAILTAVAERAMEHCQRIEGGKRIERTAIRRSSGVLGGLTLASVLFVVLGPSFIRSGASALFFPNRPAAAVNPYSVTVVPGDTTISRNSDLMITAALHGFESDEVVLFTRAQSEGGFVALPMISDGMGEFQGLLLNVAEETQYYVESGGVRSGTFQLGVADLPAVDQLQMEYHFPSYTGLPPRRFEYGGDVAALAGTTVKLTVTPTLPSPSAMLVMDSGDTIAMTTTPEGTFEGSFTVREQGFYGIKLLVSEGLWVAGAPDYRIDVLADQEPSISFAKPGRDIQASPIEEVFIEARADDDLGVAKILWIYAINGGVPDTVAIYNPVRGASLTQVTAGHTIFLEEHDLQPGDLVSYYGVATDNAPSPAQAVSDIYFLEVRPFRRDFRRAEGGGGGGGGGAGDGMENDLSQLQRQIIAASFNLVRDRDSYTAETWEENVVSVALSQQRLREQVETLAERIVNRGITGADESFSRIAEALPRAAEAMKEAEDSLRVLAPGAAVGAEQRALRELLRAEETYERFVSLEQEQQQGGGGGGRNGPDAEDLADLFELETDKLRNQYETVQRSQQQTADQGVDESLEKLRELARRQEQELERQRRRAAASQGEQAGGGSQAARELADEAEEAARQLERLSRETSDQGLQEVARELRQAADAMRRSSANRGSAGVAESQSALRRLRSARDQLEGVQDDRLRRDVADVQERAERLAEEQKEVQEQMEDIAQGRERSAEQVGQIIDKKTEMMEEARDLLDQLDQLAKEARRDNREGADELGEAAETIRDTQLWERIAYSRNLVGRPGLEERGSADEKLTAQAIQSLRNRLDEAADAVQAGQGEDDVEEGVLESARDLVRSLESLERQMGQGGRQGDREGDSGGPAPNANGGGQAIGPRSNVAPRNFSPEEVRQMRRQMRERANEAQELAALLERAEIESQPLREMISQMRALDRDRSYADPEELLALQRALVDNMKELEFELRREFGVGSEEQALIYQSGDVPDEYRALVEEYYRALSQGNSSRGANR